MTIKMIAATGSKKQIFKDLGTEANRPVSINEYIMKRLINIS